MKRLFYIFLLCCLLCGCAGSETGLYLDISQSISEESEDEETTTVKASTEEMTTIIADETIFVYVCGAVCRPGVYELPLGSRAYEALELAGGTTENAAAYKVNLADLLYDSQKLYIPLEEDDYYTVEESGNPADCEAETQKVNINTATKEQLMTLSGIGASKAEAIIDYREKNGVFKAIEEIMQVNGIKEAAFARIQDKITVS